jgi:HSP20 family protein
MSNLIPRKKSFLNDHVSRFGNAYDDLGKEFDDIFKFFGFSPLNEISKHPSFIPSISIYEQGPNCIIDVETPGMEKKDIEISISNDNIISIKGERKEEKRDKDLYTNEFSYGSFRREFSLPENVDTTKIEATCLNGILKITIPKMQKEIIPIKKIEIK